MIEEATKIGMIKETLFYLAVALTDHNHTWTDKEDRLYRSAVSFLSNWECR